MRTVPATFETLRLKGPTSAASQHHGNMGWRRLIHADGLSPRRSDLLYAARRAPELPTDTEEWIVPQIVCGPE